MVDSGVRLLSLVNQLAYSMRSVRLDFEDGEAGTMGYLNRWVSSTISPRRWKYCLRAPCTRRLKYIAGQFGAC